MVSNVLIVTLVQTEETLYLFNESNVLHLLGVLASQTLEERQLSSVTPNYASVLLTLKCINL